MSQEYIWVADKLQGEYKDAFQRVEVYANTKGIDEKYDSESMMNLLDMLLTAQEEGEPVEKIVGTDLKKFCKTYFSDYGIRERASSIPRNLYRFCKIIFILELIFTLFDATEDDFNLLTARTDMSGYLSGVLIALVVTTVIFIVIKPLLFRLKKFNSTVFYTIYLVLLLAGIVLYLFLSKGHSLMLPLFPILLITGLYIAVYKTVELTIRYRKTGTVRKAKEDYGISAKSYFKEAFDEGYNKTMEDELPIMLKKRYDRINKRREKHGKSLLAKEEYMEKLKKENQQYAFWNRITDVIISLLVIGMIVTTALSSPILDTVIFAVILITVEGLIMYGLRKSMSGAKKARERLINECEEQGITVIDYVEMKLPEL